MSDWLHPFIRRFPSANMALVRGERPLLVDTGFGSDLPETLVLLQAAGVDPADLSLIVNTHYHCDHVGGNHGLQQRYRTPIAAHAWEAALINRRDREACGAEWLDQPVEPYTVDVRLADGDELTTDTVVLRVIHTPGHSLGHICLYAPADGTLIGGDAVHADDVSWINVFREGAGALDRAVQTLERLDRLPLTRMLSGHSPVCYTPHEALRAALARYEKWGQQPERIGWHACKRIFTYALMLTDGLNRAEIAPYLLRCPWFHDYSRHVFLTEPADFIAPFLAELERAGAVIWRTVEGQARLYPMAAYTPPPPGWLAGVPRPRAWG